MPFRWTIPILKHFDSKLAALANVPDAQAHEAPNSWLMRVAAMQGCSAKELAHYLGFTFREDADFPYYFVFRKNPPAAPQVQGLEPGRIFVQTWRRLPVLGTRLRVPGGRRARYRFCPMCMKSAQVPCIHMYTSMDELVFCPWHRCLLEDQCPSCGVHLELMRDMASAGRDSHGVEDLSCCLSCSQPLHSVRPLMIDAKFGFKLPYWLRDWGRGGPTAIEGAGLSRNELAMERLRLSAPAPAPASDVGLAGQMPALVKLAQDRGMTPTELLARLYLVGHARAFRTDPPQGGSKFGGNPGTGNL